MFLACSVNAARILFAFVAFLTFPAGLATEEENKKKIFEKLATVSIKNLNDVKMDHHIIYI